MREHLAAAVWLAFMTLATSLLALGLIGYTVRVKANGDGFVEWHKVFYDAAGPSIQPRPHPTKLNVADMSAAHTEHGA